MKNKFIVFIIALCSLANNTFSQMLPEELTPYRRPPTILMQPTQLKSNDELSRERNNSLNPHENIIYDENIISESVNNISEREQVIVQSNPSRAFEDIKPDPQLSLEPIRFNSKKVNFERFRNSPCFSELGFNPNKDPEEQERRYRNCEEFKRKEKAENSFQVIFGVLLVMGFVSAIFYFAIKNKNDQQNEAK